MKRLADNVYVITGAAGGIGRAIALVAARDGAKLVLSDLQREPLDVLRQEIRQIGSDAEVLDADARDPALGERLAELATSRFGRLNGCVPCAGIVRFTPVNEIKPQQWDEVMNLNLRGAFFCVQAVARAMVAGGFTGSIVTISSTSGQGPRPNNADYGVSKAGIDHFTRTFALELAPRGIRVNAVSPGVITTPMWTQVDRQRGALLGLQPGQLLEKMKQEIPMRRLGVADDVAGVVGFLLGEESAYVTGQIIQIDGGFMLCHA